MGRPSRRDVDYYPHYVKKGKTLFILQNKYGLIGYGFFYKILDFLAITPDHHYQIKTDIDLMYLSGECLVKNENDALEMIEVMVKTGKLDQHLWDKHRVIASSDFLDSVRDAYKDRILNCTTIDKIYNKYNIEAETELTEPETEFPELEKPNNDDFEGDNPQRREEKRRKEKKRVESTSSSPCPHKEIVRLFTEILPELPVVQEYTDIRMRSVRARWREHPNLDVFKKLFITVKESDFLMGRKKEFHVSFDWIIRPTNFVKILEGNYDNRDKKNIGSRYSHLTEEIK